MSLDLMGEGVSILFNLSNEIDQLCVEKFGCPRISILDIGMYLHSSVVCSICIANCVIFVNAAL